MAPALEKKPQPTSTSRAKDLRWEVDVLPLKGKKVRIMTKNGSPFTGIVEEVRTDGPEYEGRSGPFTLTHISEIRLKGEVHGIPINNIAKIKEIY